MAPRAKQQLFYSLAQLLRAGITFPQALDKLASSARGPVRRAVAVIRDRIRAGDTVAEACAAANLGSTESAVLAAVERAGSLDRGLEQLSEYFGAIAAARGRIAARLAYPIFILILAGVLLNLPVLVREGLNAYGRTLLQVPPWLIAVLGAVIALTLLGRLARHSTLAERVLAFTPFGPMRHAFAMARFCLVYDLQLSAGINTMNALQAASTASQSPSVQNRVQRILPEIRSGTQVGPLLAQSPAFTPQVSEGIIVGEETGTLGAELQRLGKAESARAFRWLDTLSEWLPRLFYLAVLIYAGAKIVAVYKGYLDVLQSIGIE